jgi:putative pyruvate formate lyase activating enzyme
MTFIPSYIKLLNSGELKRRADLCDEYLRSCDICPRDCKTDRTQNKLGFCLSGYYPIVSSYTKHFGEEPVISGSKGAGNIFFGNCNLRCVFCQNYEISQNYKAEKNNEVSFERLAEIMLELQEQGCHNIGLVSPTHFSVQIIKSIYIAASRGLNIPIVYNTNGYDSPEILRLFEGIIDIYLPDFKYGANENSKLYSKADDYFDKAKASLKEMHRQIGGDMIYEDGILHRGLIIRHLVLPNELAETEEVFKFIAGELSTDVHISLMSQYYPTFKSEEHVLLSRKIREREYERTISLMERYNLNNGWIQELESSDNYKPEFNNNRENPFSN